MQSESPVNPIPPLVLVIFAAIMLIEAAFSLGAMGVFGAQATAWRSLAIQDYAFAPRALELLMNGYSDPALWLRLISYPFVHGSFTHAIFAGVLWIALGKFVSDYYRPWAVAVITAVTIVGAALVYGFYGIWRNGNVPMVGFYPADFGMIGAFTYITWLRLGREGGNQVQAFAMIGMLMGLQVVYSVLFGENPTWVADITGFVLGGATAILVAPGGWQALVARLRRR